MILFFIYIFTVVFSFLVYVHDNWKKGYNLYILDLFGMSIVALLPVINIIGIFVIWHNVIILKGKGRK